MESFNSIQAEGQSDQKMVSSSPTLKPESYQNSALSLIGCANIAPDYAKQKDALQLGKKITVCDEILKRLRDINHEPSFSSPDFADSIRAHFKRLPCRYI
mgnify:CR=1 FL=1